MTDLVWTNPRGKLEMEENAELHDFLRREVADDEFQLPCHREFGIIWYGLILPFHTLGRPVTTTWSSINVSKRLYSIHSSSLRLYSRHT